MSGAPGAGTRIPALGPRGEGWVLGQFVLLAAVIAAAWFGGLPLDEPALDLVRVTGAVLILVAIVIIGVGSWQLERSLSVLPHPVSGAVLVDRGLYHFVRHPIYAAVILAAAGGALYTASPLAAAFSVTLAVWLDLKARREEAWLRERFASYAAYAARTKRFVPGLY